MELTLHLLQQISVFLVIAYLFSKTPAFKPMLGEVALFRHWLLLYLVFCGFAILCTYTGLPVHGAVVNTRTIAVVCAGMIGGPVLGAGVGITAGMHQFWLGGFASVTCAAATAVAGVIAGLMRRQNDKQPRPVSRFHLKTTLLAILVAEALQVVLVLMFSRPFAEAWALVADASLPMLLANAIGAGLFMSMMRDQKSMVDKVAAMSSAKAFNIADRSLGILSKGFNEQTAQQLADIIYDETGVSAVGISDRTNILAFVGLGDDHHLPGLEIVSPQTKEAIRDNKVLFADGVNDFFQCALSDNCPLGSTLIVPMRVDNEVVGAIKLYEARDKHFLNLNKALGEGIAKLLGEKLLRDRYKTQKNLLTKAELKLIQAQINPHFLFNALNTIIAIVRKDPEEARGLLRHLSNFFRKNLKRSGDLSTLEEELDHVKSYLVIEKARFGERLEFIEDIDPLLMQLQMPTFTLQPIVENAVKHGISNLLEQGEVRIIARREGEKARIVVEDNAGAFCEEANSSGLGMNIVDKRIKNLYGGGFGLETSCVPEQLTRVAVIVPCESKEAV